MALKHSERLLALSARLLSELTEEEQKALAQAVQTASRLEAGEGFQVHPIVSMQTGEPRVDVCWMGMLAQLKPEQARDIGAGLFEAAAEAETESALLGFLGNELGFDRMQSAGALALVRKNRSSRREPVIADKQEPSAVAALPIKGSKPS